MKKILLLTFFLLTCVEQARGASLFDMAQSANGNQVQAHLSKHKYSEEKLTRALHLAVEKNSDVNVISVLVKAGADVNRNLSDSEMYSNTPDNDESDGEAYGSSPLSRADKNIPKMKALLQAGADPDASGFEGETPLLEAVMSSDAKSMEILQLLLQYKADPNRGISGPVCPRENSQDNPCTVLEFALDNPEKVRLLLDAGAHPNKLVYTQAKKKRLPSDLLQRLNPMRKPDGSKKTAR